MPKKRRLLTKSMGATNKGKLRSALLAQRRDTIYKMVKKSLGFVPCYVCGKPVTERKATLEHIIPLSKGGTDNMDNLSISHEFCNSTRTQRDKEYTHER